MPPPPSLDTLALPSDGSGRQPIPRGPATRPVGRGAHIRRLAPVIDVTDATLEEEIVARSDDVPVVVDLWAPWCGPCKTLGPIIEKVVDATGGKVVLAKINVDENPGASQMF